MANSDGLPERLLLVFLDGVGIGAGDGEANPFAADRDDGFSTLLGGALVAETFADGAVHGPVMHGAAIDATLGVEGTPQSGTGQTSLLAGFNAAAAFGRHFGPWVPASLRAHLGRRNLLSRAVAGGRRAVFANAYPLSRVDVTERLRRRAAAPPLAAYAAGVLDRDVPDLASGRAIASSITNDGWRERLGDAVPEVTPRGAGERLAAIASDADITLFAHYDSDAAGHRRDLAAGRAAASLIARFIGGIIAARTPDTLLVISSDHGNLEDITVGHTRNPVPLLAAGPGAESLVASVGSIDGVLPAVLELLRVPDVVPSP